MFSATRFNSKKSASEETSFPAWCAVFTHSRNGSTQNAPFCPKSTRFKFRSAFSRNNSSFLFQIVFFFNSSVNEKVNQFIHLHFIFVSPPNFGQKNAFTFVRQLPTHQFALACFLPVIGQTITVQLKLLKQAKGFIL